jgi:PadR family transcriptional regulator AphA
MKIGGGSTPNALLGLLSLGPMSGYDIRQLIPRSIGYFWNESYGQIYPALKRLAEAGFVEKKTERKKGSPDRHLYSLTAAGREQLRHWLKLFFGAHVSPSVSREHVEAYLKANEQTLKFYGALAKTLQKDEANDPQLRYWLMTLNMGRHRTRAMVKWCKETLKELDEIERRQKGGK